MIFRVLIILGIFAIGMVMGALWSSVDASPSKCETSTGTLGLLFENLDGYIDVPRAFDRVESSDATLRVYPKFMGKAGALVQNTGAGIAELRFFKEAQRVHTCSVEIIPFDLAEHSLDTITHGNCAWALNRDVPMLTNVAQHFETPWRYVEVSISNTSIAKITPLSDQTIYIEGVTPGLATLLLLVEGGRILEQCPIVVQPSQSFVADPGFDESLLCRDESGRRARISPRQEIYVSVADKYQEATVANIEIAQFKALSSTRVQIEGLEKGVTNLMTIGIRGAFLHSCLIVVE